MAEAKASARWVKSGAILDVRLLQGGLYVIIRLAAAGEAFNGKSLSWMGLTRERWCCTMGLVSRLDMSTCQTSIKTDILL